MFLRFLAAALGGVMLLAAPLSAGAQDSAWPLYSDSAFGFSVRFPGAPEVETKTDTVGEQPVTEVLAFYGLPGDGGLLATATRFETDIASPDKVMKDAVQTLSGDYVYIISTTPVTVQGAPAQIVDFTAPDSDYRMTALLVVKGRVLYQIVAVGHGALPKEGDAFRKSFLLLPAS